LKCFETQGVHDLFILEPLLAKGYRIQTVSDGRLVLRE